jgi:hypothetical protein
VVHRRSRLVLAIACGLGGALCTEATCLLIDAAAVVDCGLLAALFVPFLAGLGILLGTLDCGAGQCLFVARHRQSRAALAWWVATTHRSSAALLGAPTDT